MTWDNHRILSLPISVFWNGWESTTAKLQNHGWELSAYQNIELNTMQIAMKHSGIGMEGITERMDYNYYSNYNRGRYTYPNRYNPMMSTTNNPIILNCQLANKFSIQTLNNTYDDFASFRPIDARPTIMHVKTGSIEDFIHFRKLDYDAKEIFLKKATMSDILKIALAKQEPQQAKIRSEMLKREKLELLRDSKLKAQLRLVA